MPAGITLRRRISHSAALCAVFFVVLASLATVPARAQITIDTHGNPTNADGTVDRRFAQIQPTHIDLPKGVMDPRSKTALIRALEGEQGWAMRPFPRGHKGLTLVANGKLEPAGEAYLDAVTTFGLSVKPGESVAITDIKFDRDKLVLSLNGGPDAKHRFLRHIEIGMGGDGMTTPVVPDDPQNDPQGAHITLDFKGRMPAVTDKDVKALLAPLISFDQKTPVQAFTDTLPPVLKNAILNHHVIVGMTTDMVMFALGEPNQKIREMDGQMPFEEWIYGKAPDPVEFVRINGNRVIRLEIAKVGEPVQIFTKDEVEGMMRTDGTPLAPPAQTKTIAMGDTHTNPDTQAPAAPPSLHQAGDPATPVSPGGGNSREGEMRPVEFPQQKPDDYPDATNLPRTPQPDTTAKPSQPDQSKPADGQPSPSSSEDKDKKSQPSQPPAQPAQNPQPNQP